MKSRASQRAFTLVEMLVVIAIVGILTAIALPVVSNYRAGDTLIAGARQIQDDVARARHLALSQRTTVYMVFCPVSFWTHPRFTALNVAERRGDGALFEKQLNAYTFVTLRSVGDQPGRGVPRYLSPWRTLPDGVIIPAFKFQPRNNAPTRIYDPPGSTQLRAEVYGFDLTSDVPFPGEDAFDPNNPNRQFVPLPFIAFNHLGQLTSGADEYIPVARGNARYPKIGQGPPSLDENPPGNSTNAFTLVRIDWLTGRTRVEKQEFPPSP